MPRIGITVYDLLISCPGDVSDYVNIVNECVDGFNRTLGDINNAKIEAKHWSTDSFPESGDKPQELLNKQIVRGCDAAIAIFWTKFGTPTDKYGSGTEEEIEEMLSAKKQIFLYFVNEPINPSELDQKQYNKIKEFKEKYKDRGIYCEVKNKDDFRTQFTNHLTMYFLPIIMGKNQKNAGVAAPVLQIQDYYSEKRNTASIQNIKLLDSKLIKEMHQSICTQIDKLKKDYLPQRVPAKKEVNDTAGILKIQNSFLPTRSDVSISKSKKDTILTFCHHNSLEIPEQFWNLGDLKQQTSKLPFLPYYNNNSLEGTDAEQERYEAIINLYSGILKYNEYYTYFSQIENQRFVSLVIANIGASFDEDIDVKLIFEKGCILGHQDIPCPGQHIIEDILESQFIEFIYGIDATDSICKYTTHSITHAYLDTNIKYPFSQPSESERYENRKRSYRDHLENVLCYEVYKKRGNDILKFHIPYLKHNTKMAFPSVLILKNQPKKIEYEITSKHISDVIKGEISFSPENPVLLNE